MPLITLDTFIAKFTPKSRPKWPRHLPNTQSSPDESIAFILTNLLYPLFPYMNTTTTAPTVDDLNDIARAIVDAAHGARPPAHYNADECDEWQAEADRLFFVACESL
jgi:hypothetical protein